MCRNAVPYRTRTYQNGEPRAFKTHKLGKKLYDTKPARSPNEASHTMTTIDIIKECILALNERTGSSVQAMTKWIQSEKQVRFV